MDSIWKRLRKLRSQSRLSCVICLFVCVLCLLFVLNSNLPELQVGANVKASNRIAGQMLEEVRLGGLGEMMVAMLPDDLAFSIFIPSEEAFENTLRLHADDSLTKQKLNDTFAILSRLMGFSAVPQHLPSRQVQLHKAITLDSVSGYILHAWRTSDGTLVVNNIKSKQVDIKRGEIIVHVMDGVIMDAEFAQSF